MNQFGHSVVRLAGLLSLSSVLALAQTTIGRPGAINYVEGNVTLNGRTLGPKAVGSTEVAPGQTLATGQGKAEMLLTPGVFARLDDQSSLQMVSAGLADTEIKLVSGRVMVEVDQIQKENHLVVIDNGVSTTLEKKGLYRFAASPAMLSVYDGKAVAQIDDRTIDVGKGKQLPLMAGVRKTQKFDREATGELYAWSSLRSSYMAQANAASAQTIIADNPYWYYGTGWYWNPWFDSWAFVPGAGYLYSPFGFGFYSPAFVYYGGPFYGGYWGGYHGFRGTGRVGGFRGTPAPAFRGSTGFHAGGFGRFHGGGHR
jgi:hypothetical protein